MVDFECTLCLNLQFEFERQLAVNCISCCSAVYTSTAVVFLVVMGLLVVFLVGMDMSISARATRVA